MIVSPGDEPEVGIHITGTESRAVKRPASKQKNKGSTPKKPRIASLSNSNSTPNTRKTTAEAPVVNDRVPDVSFRHLFSFAKDSQADTQQQKALNATDAAQSFGFLHEDKEAEQGDHANTDVEPRSPYPDMDYSSHGRKEVYSPTSDHRTGMQSVQGISGSSYGRDLVGHRKSKGSTGDSAGPTQFPYQRSYRHENHQVKATSDILMIPDDIDSRPDEILRIATMFCRQESVAQLEEDWCAPGGVRETMRRDFKQKRQNAARGRKLGSSGKR